MCLSIALLDTPSAIYYSLTHMIRNFIETVLGRGERGPSILEVRKARFGDLIALQLPEDISEFHLEPSRLNLRYAMEIGIKPVSISDVISQLPNVSYGNIIYFDSFDMHPGNHWRVEHLEGQTAVLLFCSTFGMKASHKDLRIIVPVSEPLFTGVTLPNFRAHGEHVSLDHAARLVSDSWFAATSPFNFVYPKELAFTDETILFADSAGKLDVSPKKRV
jgi:hypothetical protein